MRGARLLSITGALSFTGRHGRCRIHKSGPFKCGAIRIDCVVDTTRFASRVGGVGLAIFIAEPSHTVTEFVRYRVPSYAERKCCKPATATATEPRVVEQNQDCTSAGSPRVQRV